MHPGFSFGSAGSWDLKFCRLNFFLQNFTPLFVWLDYAYCGGTFSNLAPDPQSVIFNINYHWHLTRLLQSLFEKGIIIAW
jgi:hypothetical protein